MPVRLPFAATALVLAVLAPASLSAAPLVDLGEPSVQSQRGQKLRLALPYGSAPGERVSASRFELVSISAPDGYRAPDVSQITIAKPERRNVVYMQSREPIDAPELTVTVRVAGDEGGPQTWRLGVPPARASAPAMSVPMRGSDAERPARRVPTAIKLSQR